jgi:23S rRNA (uridine2552-2'-O)-methyltransferase
LFITVTIGFVKGAAVGRETADYYAKRAKKEGYPARSVFKLEEIQKKQAILQRGDTVLDIGAAPGSWSLYAARTVGPEGQVVAVDLQQLDPQVRKQSNISALQGDAFGEELQASIREHAPYQVILSDAAPSTTGNRTADTARSEALVEQLLDAAPGLLAPGGNLVVKLFQGGEERELLEAMRSSFSKAKPLKPKASRKDSFEIFLIGLEFTAAAGEEPQ